MSSFNWFRRMGRVPRGAVVGVGLAALAWLALVAASVRHGYRECHPWRSRVSAARAAQAKQLLPGLRELQVRTKDNLSLRSWFVPPRNGVVLVVMPGLTGNRASHLDEAVLFAQHGYGSLLLEPRAHGDSEGTTATWGYLEADDVVQAVKTAYAIPGVSKVGALGFSVGASAVALAAARDPNIRAVVLYATWTSLREEIAAKAGSLPSRGFWTTKGYELAGVDVDAVHPEPQMKRIAPRPVLLLSGAVDTDTPPSVMDRILAACGPSATLWRLASVGHGGYIQAEPKEYERRVIGFLDQAFAPGPTP